MGAEPWMYFVPYCKDLGTALGALQEQVFQEGRFRLSELAPNSIDEARKNAGGNTASILDMRHFSAQPALGCVTLMSPEAVRALFGTDQPSREQLAADTSFFEGIGRGYSVCIVAYADGQPSEFLFAGYSFD